MAGERVLIVDDERLIRWAIRERLADEGFVLFEAANGKETAERLDREEVDLLLVDFRLPDTTGIEILKDVRKRNHDISVVILTAYGTVETAVAAMKLGAFDYLTKPVNLDELVLVVRKALETTRIRREIRRLREESRRRVASAPVIGKSPKMIEVLDLVEKVAASLASTVLIEGESGTGKDLVAKAIHYGSPRADRPFVNITCSALTETLLELAEGGAAFLDAVAEMWTAMQAKLLRFLEEKTFKRVGGTRDIRVDVRVIAATNRVLQNVVR